MQITRRHKSASLGIILLVFGVIFALCVGMRMPRAYAVPSVDEAQAALDEAEARMEAVTAEYTQLKAEYDALQLQIDETVAKAMEAQQKVIEGRADLGTLANYEYRGGSLGKRRVACAARARSPDRRKGYRRIDPKRRILSNALRRCEPQGGERRESQTRIYQRAAL